MQVAIKPFPRGSEAEQKMMRREIDILQNAARQCAHTCRMYGTCAKQEGFCIVMKLYEGTLAHAMQKLPGDALCILSSQRNCWEYHGALGFQECECHNDY